MDKAKTLKQPIVPPRPSQSFSEEDSKTLKSRDSHQDLPDSKIAAAKLPNLRIRSKQHKKGMFNNLINGKILLRQGMFGESRDTNSTVSTKPVISTPFNPVHLAHVGFDAEAGVFTVPHFLFRAYRITGKS